MLNSTLLHLLCVHLPRSVNNLRLLTHFKTFDIDVCCVSETRHTGLKYSHAAPHYLLKHGSVLSVTPVTMYAMARGSNDVSIVLSMKAEGNLVDWIPINSRICAVCLGNSIRRHSIKIMKRHISVIAAYAPTHCSSESTEDDFYR